MAAPSNSPIDAPSEALSAPESAQDPSAGTERRPGGPNGPQTGAQSLGVLDAAPDCPACARVAADDAEPCCVCGSPDVTYRNYRDMPFCQACANCGCGQTPCVRTPSHPFVNAVHCPACCAWWLDQIDRD